MPRKGMPAPNRGKGRNVTWLRAHVDHQGERCLIWPFGKDDHGYGQCAYNGKLYRASRLMCIFKHGDPPSDEHQAAHACGNGHLACTHPGHIFWRTPFENRMESNEHGTGRPPAPRRLTIEDVEKIRSRTDGYISIAADYGVHRDTIGKIKRGETWTNPRCKLTAEQIRRIRAWSGPASRLAAEFGLSVSQIQRIRDGGTHQGVE